MQLRKQVEHLSYVLSLEGNNIRKFRSFLEGCMGSITSNVNSGHRLSVFGRAE
jgi:hypothetical protein